LAFERIAAPAFDARPPTLDRVSCSGNNIDDAANSVRAIERGLLAAQDFDLPSAAILTDGETGNSAE